jgi:hypothetical protein
VQTSDRLALRELAYQVAQQTGSSLLAQTESVDDDDKNPFLDDDPAIPLLPAAHLPQLISVLPTLTRPTIVILEGFDLFALHPRQSLLYCLLDTVQSCRSTHGNRGIAVIGVTTRVDTINLLEKRVKSRFSGRILRTAAPSRFEGWLRIATDTLCSPIGDSSSEWSGIWTAAVDKFMTDSTVLDILKETYALSRDFRMLCRILVRSFSRRHERSQPLITLAGDTDSRNKAIRAVSLAHFAPLGSCCPTTPAAFPPPTRYAYHTIQRRHSPELNATKHSRDLPIHLSADRGNAPGHRRTGHDNI